MAHIKEVRELPLEDLVVGKGQVRVRDVGKEIDELAESIRINGLLEPIVVSPADKQGKYEVLTGQRRLLAHQRLGKKTILAAILDEQVDETMAKVISLTENLVRRDLNNRDVIDACSALYRKYGSIKEVADETGLPYNKVREAVKFDRLKPELKELVQNNEVELKVALRAQDASDATGYKAEEAVKLAKEMSGMSGVQQDKIVKELEANPETEVDDAIEDAKTGKKVTQVLVTLLAEVHRSLQEFAKSEGTTVDDAASDLIQQGLSGKGF